MGSPPPEHTIEMVFEKIPGGAGPFNLWTVNGKSYRPFGPLAGRTLHGGLDVEEDSERHLELRPFGP